MTRRKQKATLMRPRMGLLERPTRRNRHPRTGRGLVVAFVGLAAARSTAGTVTFTPSSQFVMPGQVVRMELTVHATGIVTTINSVDALIFSNGFPFDFEYSDEFINSFPIIIRGIDEFPWFGHFLVSGANPAAGVGASISLGTVTVQTIGLEAGTYTVGVDTDLDGFSGIVRGLPGKPFVTEPLFGRGTFTVVPEPASLALLAVGVLGSVRRRMTHGLLASNMCGEERVRWDFSPR